MCLRAHKSAVDIEVRVFQSKAEAINASKSTLWILWQPAQRGKVLCQHNE